LIVEDKNTDLEGGWEVMVQSAEVGNTLQSLTAQEDLLETILTEHTKQYKESGLIVDNKAHDRLNEMDVSAMANPVKVEVTVSYESLNGNLRLVLLHRGFSETFISLRRAS
jgi:hypothetical protein